MLLVCFYLLMIEGSLFVFRLVCLPLRNLDVIQGMVCLVRYHAFLDCALRTVVFPKTGVSDYLSKN